MTAPSTSPRAIISRASSRQRYTELAPCVIVKHGPVKPQLAAVRVATMLPMFDVYDVDVDTSET